MSDQERLFKWRAGNPGGVTDAQLANLRLASQMGGPSPHRTGGAGHRGRGDHRRPQIGATRPSGTRKPELATGRRPRPSPSSPAHAKTSPPWSSPALPSPAGRLRLHRVPRSPPRLPEGHRSRTGRAAGLAAGRERQGLGLRHAAGRTAVAARGRRRGELQPGPGRCARSPPQLLPGCRPRRHHRQVSVPNSTSLPWPATLAAAAGTSASNPHTFRRVSCAPPNPSRSVRQIPVHCPEGGPCGVRWVLSACRVQALVLDVLGSVPGGGEGGPLMTLRHAPRKSCLNLSGALSAVP